MTQQDPIEKSLTKRLRGSFSASEIKDFSDLISKLNIAGMKVDDAFPQGIISPDTLTVKGHLPIENISKLGDLIKDQVNLRELKVFPRGIPAQENWRIHMSLQKP